MGMLKPAENRMAFAKVGVYGDAGSGKTVTAALLAIGIHKYYELTKPVAMFDTEPGASFIIPLFKAAKIPFMVFDESRALVDALQFLREAEQEASIGLFDSVTHIWRDTQASLLKRLNEGRSKKIAKLEFHHWNIIKPQWAVFTDMYLHSKIHCIICGRAGSIYEYQENSDGKKELITTGTKMATEKEMGYEPSLLIEMSKYREKGRIINRAMIEKDRSMNYNGREFDFTEKSLTDWLAKPEKLPKPFTDLLKHFDALNIGGKHFDSLNKRDSSELYNADGDSTWSKESREREIWAEEIKGLMIKHGLDGTSADVKKRRVELLQEVFGTTSWTKIENLHSSAIKNGYERMRAQLDPESIKATEPEPDLEMPAAGPTRPALDESIVADLSANMEAAATRADLVKAHQLAETKAAEVGDLMASTLFRGMLNKCLERLEQAAQ